MLWCWSLTCWSPRVFVFLSMQVLEVLHAHEGTINQLVWAPRLMDLQGADEPVAVLASSSSDRRVRIWRSPKSQEQ